MWQLITGALLAGLAAGPACALHCGVFQMAFLSRLGAERSETARAGLAILAGRLLAYVMLGLVLGAAAGSDLVVLRSWVVHLLFGLLLAGWVLVPRGAHGRGCAIGALGSATAGAPGWLRRLSLGLAAGTMGFLTGLSPCPPLLASGLLAYHAGGVAGAVLTFMAFFVGSTLVLLPAVFGLVALPAPVRLQVARAGRVAVGLAALYALSCAAQGFRAARVDDPVAINGAEAPADPAVAAEERAGRLPVPPPARTDTMPLFAKEAPSRLFTASLVQRLDLSLEEARFYTALPEGSVACELCPRLCQLADGEQGMCRARANIDGRLRSLVYGRPVATHVDPVEKKPLFHVLPGSRALSLATVGCNLGCVFCQNHQISQTAPEDVPRPAYVPPERVVQVAVDRGFEGIAYTYTEPTVFYEYMMDIATRAREAGVLNYWITCGQIEEEPLRELCTVMDAANVDLKGFSDDFYVEYCDAHLFPVLRTLRILREEGVHTEITNLVIPQANDDPAMIRAMCEWIVGELGPDVPLHFSAFRPDYKLRRRPPTPVEALVRARDIARAAGVRHVYIGNARLPGAGQTDCPTCGRALILRRGYLLEEGAVRDGVCPGCGTRIAGLWADAEE